MSTDTQSNNKRIAKNTLLLYVRMLLLMVVSLYTSRVILNALGVEDYGIYNVVGGVVTMFTMLSGSLTAAIQRFLNFELGTGNSDKLKKIFSSAVTIQIGLAAIIIVLAETVGLWFVNAKLVIPTDRMMAANWVYQFSIITFAVNLINVPYNAAIIAHEKMSAFAYISIVEALVKLVIAWTIVVTSMDRLIYFGGMLCLLAVMLRALYGRYCKMQFEECSYHFTYDHNLLKEMFGFAGWNFIGASSSVLRDQGGNIIINLFFGPAVNAARAIAVKLNAVVTGFVQNFMTALNPQITKSYASGEHEYMFKLMYQGARLSYYILLLLSLPIILNTNYLLVIWLKLVPEYTVLFVQLTLVFALCESISNPLITAMLATGKIKNYQIVVGGLQLLNLPFAYICLRLGSSPESVLYVAIFISQCCLATRLYMLRGMIGLKISYYLKHVYFNVIIVTLLAASIPFAVKPLFSESFSSFIFLSLISVSHTVLVELYIGCKKEERQLVFTQLNKIIRKIHK